MKAVFGFFLTCCSVYATPLSGSEISAQANPKKPVIIEAYGDSLTAAFLGGEKHLEDPPGLKEVSSTLSDLAMFLVTNEAKYKDPYEYRTTGWPARLAKKLSAHHGLAFEARNYGRISAETPELPEQLKGLPNGTSKRTMAFVFIGHNDFVEMGLTVEQLAARHKKGLNDFFKEWDKRHWFSTMIIIPVGDVYKVYHRMNDLVWFKNQTVTYKCNDSWNKFFPYARSYYQLFQQGTIDSYFIPRIDAFRRAEREIAREWNWTSWTNNYYYYEPKTAFPYEPRNFAVDCFHLAANGQEQVAQATFDAMHSMGYDFNALREGSDVATY